MTNWTRILTGDTSTQFNYYQDGNGHFARVQEADDQHRSGTVSAEGAPKGGQVLEGVSSDAQLRQLMQLDHARETASAPEPMTEANGTQRAAPTVQEQDLFSRLSRVFGGGAQGQARALAYIDNPPTGTTRENWISNELQRMTQTPPPTPQSLNTQLDRNLRTNLQQRYVHDFGMPEDQAQRMSAAVPADQLVQRAQQTRLLVEVRQQLTGGTPPLMTDVQFQQFAVENHLAGNDGLPASDFNPALAQQAVVQAREDRRQEDSLRTRLRTVVARSSDGRVRNNAEIDQSVNQIMDSLPRNVADRRSLVSSYLGGINANTNLNADNLRDVCGQSLRARVEIALGNLYGNPSDNYTHALAALPQDHHIGQSTASGGHYTSDEVDHLIATTQRAERLLVLIGIEERTSELDGRNVALLREAGWIDRPGVINPNSSLREIDSSIQVSFFRRSVRDVLQRSPLSFSRDDAMSLSESLPLPYGHTDTSGFTDGWHATPAQMQQSLRFLESYPSREALTNALLPQAREALAQRIAESVSTASNSAVNENDLARARLWVSGHEAGVHASDRLNFILQRANYLGQEHPNAVATAFRTELRNQLPQIQLPASPAPQAADANLRTTGTGPTNSQIARALSDARARLAGNYQAALPFQEMFTDILGDAPPAEVTEVLNGSEHYGHQPNLGGVQQRLLQYWEDHLSDGIRHGVNGTFISEPDAHAVARHLMAEALHVPALPRDTDEPPQMLQQGYLHPASNQVRDSSTSACLRSFAAVQNLGINGNVNSAPAYADTQREARQNFVTQAAAAIARDHPDGVNRASPRQIAVAYLRHLEETSANAHPFDHPGELQRQAQEFERDGPAAAPLRDFVTQRVSTSPRQEYERLMTYVNASGNEEYSRLLAEAGGVQASTQQPGIAHPASVPAEAVFVGRYNARGNSDVYALPDGSRMWIVGNNPRAPLSGTPDEIRARPDASIIPADIFTRIGQGGGDAASLASRGVITTEQADLYTILHPEAPTSTAATPATAPARGHHGHAGHAARTAAPSTPPPVDEGARILRELAAEGTTDGPAHRHFERYLQLQTALRFLQTHQAAGISTELTQQHGIACGILRAAPPLPPAWPSGDHAAQGLSDWANSRANPGMTERDQMAFAQELRQDQVAARAAQEQAAAATAGAPTPVGAMVYTVTAPINTNCGTAFNLRFTSTGTILRIPAHHAVPTGTWVFRGRTIANNNNTAHVTEYFQIGSAASWQKIEYNVPPSTPAGSFVAANPPPPPPAFTALSGGTRMPATPASTTPTASTTTPRLTAESVRLDTERRQVMNEFLGRYPGASRDLVGLQVLRGEGLIDEYGNPTANHTPQEIANTLFGLHLAPNAPIPPSTQLHEVRPDAELQGIQTEITAIQSDLGGAAPAEAGAATGARGIGTKVADEVPPAIVRPASTGATTADRGAHRPAASTSSHSASESDPDAAIMATGDSGLDRELGLENEAGGTGQNGHAVANLTQVGQRLDAIAHRDMSPATRVVVGPAMNQTYVEGVHQHLLHQGLDARQARAIEMHLGLTRDMEGHVAQNLNTDIASNLFHRVVDEDNPRHLSVETLTQETIADWRQGVEDQLITRMHLSPDDAARYMISRHLFGDEHGGLVNLGNLAEDHLRLQNAETSPIENTNYARDIHTAVAQNQTLPSSGELHDEVQRIREAHGASAEGEGETTGGTGGAGSTGHGGRNAGHGAAAGAGHGRGTESADSRAHEAGEDRREARRERSAMAQARYTSDRQARATIDAANIQARATRESSRTSARAQIATARIHERSAMAQERMRQQTAMLQAMLQLLGQLIAAAIGAMAQMQAANIGAVAQINAGLTQSRSRAV
ncbi:MAG: hypothetical protein HQM15_09520 [Deltaproteobacteria bacterium]|nr:hypothetical protein [Deltaproteobacteria bacterium]